MNNLLSGACMRGWREEDSHELYGIAAGLDANALVLVAQQFHRQMFFRRGDDIVVVPPYTDFRDPFRCGLIDKLPDLARITFDGSRFVATPAEGAYDPIDLSYLQSGPDDPGIEHLCAGYQFAFLTPIGTRVLFHPFVPLVEAAPEHREDLAQSYRYYERLLNATVWQTELPSRVMRCFVRETCQEEERGVRRAWACKNIYKQWSLL